MGRVASTLGESLNTVLPIFALALRLNSSLSLPWLPSSQFTRAVDRSPIDLHDVFDMKKLALLYGTRLRRPPPARCGTLAVWLPFRRDRHDPTGRTTVGYIRTSTAPLSSTAAWEALILHIKKYTMNHSGTTTVFARMDGFSELGCGLCAPQYADAVQVSTSTYFKQQLSFVESMQSHV